MFWILILFLFPAALWVEVNSTTPTATAAGPPRAKVAPVEEIIHGQKIVDKYRWLEDANSPETQA
ncbi:MAG TPA: hypothetical protein VEG30_12785, partial [Terriglobales bacterium]|nr:hypothetical protein [Terriglobales bacterium]